MFEFNQNTTHEKPSLPDYPYRPVYVEINNTRLHFIDEGEKNAPVILFLHGVPTWSYTFRKIYPFCLDAGYRIIAPDLPGFGRSEKPLQKENYTIQNLVKTISGFIRSQKLTNFFLFAHDWGAIIGMILAADNPGWFKGIIVCNGYLPDVNAKAPFLFSAWQIFCKYSPILPIGEIVNLATKRKLSVGEKRAYDFPFNSGKEKIAIRILPQLIPVKTKSTDAGFIENCWKKLQQLEKPFLTVFSSNDSITAGGDKLLQQRIPGAKNQAHKIIPGKHFLQEDAPEELELIINQFVKTNL